MKAKTRRKRILTQISRVLAAQRDGETTRLTALYAIDMLIAAESDVGYVYKCDDDRDELADTLVVKTRI